MAFNLLQIAKFINGERPSADKFNSIFTFIDSKIRNTNISLGSNISDESTKVSIYDENTQTNILFDTSKKGFKQKEDNEFVLNARKRHIDLASITNVIGSASNLNPLMLNETQTIKETIPAGVTEYNIKYPIPILDLLIELGNLNSPSFQRYVGNTMALVVDGDYHVGYRNKFSVNEIDFTTEIIWNKPTEIATELEYTFNPGKISNSMLSYQGASYNTIPDFNTPKNASSVFVGNEEYFYNLKFSERDSEGYVTITLPFVKYVSLNVDNQETSELNSGNPTFHNQIKLPEIFKMIQTESEVSEFLIPKGLLYLVHFDNPSEKLIDNDYIYVNETTIKVSGISDDLLNCLLSEPGTQNYKQMHLLTVGTDITTSILDIRNKLSSHNHDGSFGEEKIHIKNIEGIYEYRSIFNSRVYYPTKLQGHIATQYLHRDGYRYNSDPQNADNAILGDLLLKSNSFNSSFKLFFGEEAPFPNRVTGQNLLPGYLLLTNNLKFSWIGLSSNLLQSETDISFNIQGSENSHVSIISNRDLNIASKDKIVSIIKNVNTFSESEKILDSSYDWPAIQNEASAQIQKENINASINQTQISLFNDNNKINLYNWDNFPSSINIVSKNKTVYYSEFPDKKGRTVGLNSIQLISEFNGTADNEIITFTQGTNTSLFQKKEEYLSDKRDDASKDYFKKEIPSYKKEYKQTPDYNFNEQNGAFENTKILEINNATEKKEGCFVYVIQHLVDDRKDPDFKIYSFKVQALNYNYFSEINSMISKKHIYNKTYDLVRYSKIKNKESIYDTYTKKNLETSFLPNISGDLMFVNNNTGYLSTALYDSNDNEIENRYLIFNQMDGQLYDKKYNFSNQNVNPIDPSIFNQSKIKRWYKHNPFPCSKEYVNQHFYIYAYAIDSTPHPINVNDEHLKHNLFRFTSEFTGNSNNPSVIEDLDYYSSLSKSRVLTKVIWKKFWLKENVNSSSFDFEELLSSGENKFNNSKYILVNQGYLIDCAIPPSKDHSIEEYQWDLSGDFASKARDNNYKRICEFYEVDKSSEFYNLYPDWIAGQTFEPVVSFEPSANSNLNALNATITGGLPFTRHGNLQNSNDYQTFFNYFKKHEFEDDNVILYFGKGFVHFNEIVNGTDDDFKFDIVIDNDWTLGSIDNIFFDRTLNIKLKEKYYFERNYKSKQDIKIVFSDFNAENLSLINKILPENQKIHSSLINSYPSVIDYLYNLYGYVTNDEDQLLRIFKDSSDYKLFNRFVWQRKVLGEFLNLKESFQNTDYINNKKFTEFFESRIFPSSYADVGLNNTLFNSSSSFKPRTFFTFINVEFEKESNTENSNTENYSRKLNNQINLKTNESADHFVNCRNLLLKTKATFDWVYESDFVDGFVISRNNDSCFNIGPIQGFYNIEIEKFTNNEKSWWSITDQFLLNEKFGCSLFNIKVNTDFNYCLIV